MKDTYAEVLQCRASPALVAALDEIAAMRNIKRSVAIRDAVQRYIDNYKMAKDEVDDPIREEILYLHDVLLQSVEVDSLVKKEVERLWQMIREP